MDGQKAGGLVMPAAHKVQVIVAPSGAVAAVALTGDGNHADLRLRSRGERRGDGGADKGGEAVSVKLANPKEDRSAKVNQRCGLKELCSCAKLRRISREQRHGPAL